MTRFGKKIRNRLRGDALLRRLSSGMFWMTFGTGVSKVFTLLSIIFAGRLLGKSGFGEMSMIRDTCGMFGTFAGLGLGITLVKFVAELCSDDSSDEDRRIIGGILVLGALSVAVASVLLLAGAGFLCDRMLNAPDIVPAMRLGVLLFISSAGTYFMSNALIGMESFRALTVINIAEGVLHLPAVLIGCRYAGVEGCIAAFTLATGAGLLAQCGVFIRETRRRKLTIRFGFPKKLWKILWTFSIPAFAASLLATPVYWLVKVFLTWVPDGYAELGIYSAGFRFQGVLMLLAGIVNAAILPVLLSKEGRGHQRLQVINVIAPWCIGMFFALPLMLFPETVQLLYGPDYSGRSFNLCFSLIMFSCVIILFKQSIHRNIVTRGIMWLSLVSNILWGGLMIVGAYLFARYGAIGLAGVTAAVYVLTTLLFYPIYIGFHVFDPWIACNRYTLILWGILVGCCAVALTETSIGIRAAVLSTAIPLTFWAMINILRHSGRVRLKISSEGATS